MRLHPVLVAVLVLAFVPAARAAEDKPQPADRLVYEALAGARVNPLGATFDLTAGYRHRLTDSKAILLANTWTGLFFTPSITPSNWKVGASLVAQPLAVLRLGVRYDFLGYFGTWDELQSYPSTAANFSPDARSIGGKDGRNYVTTGTWLTLDGRLQMQVGDFAAMDTVTFIRTNMDLRPGDTFYYDSTLDILAPGHGWVFTNQANLIWLPKGPLAAGLQWTATGAIESVVGNNPTTHRIGPLVAWTFPTGPGERFMEPTLIVVLNWWLAHPYRTGQAVSQAVPYLTLAFSWNGNLL